MKGVIVAKSVDLKLRYATSMVPDIHLFEYSVRFDISPVVLE